MKACSANGGAGKKGRPSGLWTSGVETSDERCRRGEGNDASVRQTSGSVMTSGAFYSFEKKNSKAILREV